MNIEILVNGRPIKQYCHNGEVYVEGREGSEYSIRVINPRFSRVKAIVSVDGLSVLDGKEASELSKGYLLDSKGSITIDGWRVSNDTVRKFKFGKVSRSYSKKVGSGVVNCGVIGVMMFEEKVSYDYTEIKPIYWSNKLYHPLRDVWTNNTRFGGYNDTTGISPYHSSAQLSASCSTEQYTSSRGITCSNSYEPEAESSLGTEMGRTKCSLSYEVSFDHELRPFSTEYMYYDDVDGLKARGIDVKRRNRRPNPFPASNRYCVEV